MKFGSPGIFRCTIDEKKFCSEFTGDSKDLCIEKISNLNAENKKDNISDVLHGLGAIVVSGIVFTLVSMTVRKMLGWKEEVVVRGFYDKKTK